MGAKHHEELVTGEDSFLDTIANLTGILIIMVVIVGAKSQTEAMTIARREVETQKKVLAQPLEKTSNLERDVEHQLEQLQKYEQELAFRDSERRTILDQVNMVEHVLNEETNKLDENSKEDLAIQQELSELQNQLSKLLGQQGDMPVEQQSIVALQHLPTPMAKTVFGKELHVMCKRGMVSVIPWDRLVEALRQEARRSAERNTQKDKFANRLGPIDGFIMQYGLIAKTGVVTNGSMKAVGKLIELDRFELEPTDEVLRETVEKSLATGGRLRTELSAYNPQQTTVTVWVYPDSFHEFRILKEELFRRGFLCAARPLPEHIRIGASPRGSSSAAQ